MKNTFAILTLQIICFTGLFFPTVSAQSEADELIKANIAEGDLEGIKGFFFAEEQVDHKGRTLSLVQLFEYAFERNQPAIANFFVEKLNKLAVMKNYIEAGDKEKTVQFFRFIKWSDIELSDLLRYSVNKNDPEMVEFFIDGGANKALAYYLKEAVKKNFIDVARVLIKKGADVNGGENNIIYRIDAPLHIAIEKGYDEMMQLLVSNGADPDLQVNSKVLLSPVHYAARYNRLKAMNLLLDKGADINILTLDGVSALHKAVAHNNKEMVNLLLLKGAKVNTVAAFFSNSTPLYTAILEKKEDIAKMLVNHGADVNQPNGASKEAPLHQAAKTGNIELVQLLIKSGAHVNMQALNGNTALHYAIENDKIEIIKLLLTENADKEIKNTKNKTPLMLAKERKNKEIIKLLK